MHHSGEPLYDDLGAGIQVLDLEQLYRPGQVTYTAQVLDTDLLPALHRISKAQVLGVPLVI